MEELRDDGHGDAAASLAFFREHRWRLGSVVSAAVTSPSLSGDDPFTLILRDSRGTRMLLSGCAAGYAGDAPCTARQVLVEAGFSADVVTVVFTHHYIRLSRTPNGTTFLERATEPLPSPAVSLAATNLSLPTRPIGGGSRPEGTRELLQKPLPVSTRAK